MAEPAQGAGFRSCAARLAVLLWAAGPVHGDVLAGVLLPALGIYDVPLDPSAAGDGLDLWQPQVDRRAGVDLARGDLVRRWVEGVRVADASSGDVRVWASLPFARRGLSHRLRVEAVTGSLRSAGRSRDPGWSGRLDASASGGRVEYAAGSDRFQAGVSAAGWAASGQDQAVDLSAFHRSPRDARMNRYFWDLLEPTVGRRVVGDWRLRSWEVGSGAVWRTGPLGRLGLSARVERVRPGVGVAYLNTGSRAELAGPRRARVEQVMATWRYGLAYERILCAAWRLRLEAGYARTRLEAQARQLQVPSSSRGVRLDIADLGQGSSSRHGADGRVCVRWSATKSASVEALLGRGAAAVDAAGQGTTPVLGFSLGTLPISHRGQADVSGRMHTTVAALRAQWQGRRAELGVGALSARGTVDATVRGDAQMEFGLYVEPYRDRSRYRVDLHRLQLAPNLRLCGRWWLGYRLTQYVVFARNLDRRRPPLPRDERLRGGTLQGVSTWYAL